MNVPVVASGLCLAAVVSLGACGGEDQSSTNATSVASTPSQAAAATVVVKDFSFTTKSVTVARGASVAWKNDDAFLHTVTSGKVDGPVNVPDGVFDHPLVASSGTATVTFEKPGTFTYYCKQHNAMNGTVIVTA